MTESLVTDSRPTDSRPPKHRLPELLAPAGSPEALHAAIEGGADAVYFGGTEFSGRMRAKNFDAGQLTDAIRLCRTYSVASHITLNTRLRDRELPRVLAMAAELYEAGADAFIVADLGLASLLRETMPDISLHASTQLTGSSPLDAEVLASLGFDRMICPRELSLDEMCRLAAASPISIEAFVHGAHCVSVSGQCLMSWAMGGRSGNRGECAQPCRLPFRCGAGRACGNGKGCGGCGADEKCAAGETYGAGAESKGGRAYGTGREGESGFRGSRSRASRVNIRGGGRAGTRAWETHPLSLKDMCLAAHIPELISSGVASLKIEGRLKSPDYVYGVTRIYRRLLDEGRGADGDELRELDSIFSRDGFTDGYFTGNYSRMRGVREEVAPPSAVKFTSLTRKVPLMAQLKVISGEPTALTLTTPSGDSVTVSGDVPEVARTAPLSEDDLFRNLSKFGATPFSLSREDAEITAEGEPWMAAAQINSLRRSAVEALEAKLSEAGRRQPPHICIDTENTVQDGQNTAQTEAGQMKADAPLKDAPLQDAHLKDAHLKGTPIQYAPLRYAHFRRAAQIPDGAACGDFFDVVFLPLHELPEDLAGEKLALALPPYSADDMETERILSDYAGRGGVKVLVSTLSQLCLAVKHGLAPVTSFRFNITGSAAARVVLSLGAELVTLSPELPAAAMRAVSRELRGYNGSAAAAPAVVAYGKLPLMLLKRCVAANPSGDVFPNSARILGAEDEAELIVEKISDKISDEISDENRDKNRTGRCGRPGGYMSCPGGTLTDRTGEVFPVLPVEGCMNEVVNSRPIWSADGVGVDGAAEFFLFTDESREEATRVIDAYRKHLPPPDGKKVKRL